MKPGDTVKYRKYVKRCKGRGYRPKTITGYFIENTKGGIVVKRGQRHREFVAMCQIIEPDT